MDSISNILEKNIPIQENLALLQKVMSNTVDSITKQDICEIGGLGRFSVVQTEIIKAVLIALGNEFGYIYDFQRLFNGHRIYINKLEQINPQELIEDHLIDKLSSIIYLQDLNCPPYPQVFSLTLIWLKAYLEIQILIRGFKT